MERQCFKDLVVWQKAHGLFLDVAKDVEDFPKNKAADIVARQILRSSSSVGANIAEGNARHKGKEYEHYLIVARGSLSETENWLIASKDLGYFSAAVYEQRVAALEEIMRMLNSLIGKIRASVLK